MAKDFTLQLDESSKGSLCEETLSQLIQLTIPLIGHETLLNGDFIILDWNHFETYINSKIEPTDSLHDFFYAHIIITLNTHIIKQKQCKNHTLFYFNSVQSAIAYYHFLQYSLPIKNLEFPKLSKNEVTLSHDQLHYINRTALLIAQHLSDEFVKDCYLKTLRADDLDFTSTFLTTLFNTDDHNRALQNLRPTNRRNYIVDANGTIFNRYEKKSYTAKDKKGFTQIQSVSLIDDSLLSSAFGHSRRDTLYGLITHHNDLLISRLLKFDRGTVNRPFETDDLEKAHDLAQKMKTTKTLRDQFSEAQLSEFKKENFRARVENAGTNEVLARLRFNPHRSFVGICSDTLSSRLLAYDFSEELWENFTEAVLAKDCTINPRFKIPVIIYAKQAVKEASSFRKFVRFLDDYKKHELQLYTQKMRQNDIEKCMSIYKDEAQRQKHYKTHQYEFLLGLSTLTPEIFEEVIDGIPLALWMLQNGYARMLLRLLRPARLHNMPPTNPNLENIIFDRLLKTTLLIKNDSIIAELIRIEAFELARRLIAETNSNIFELYFRKQVMVDPLIAGGNPRQIQFMRSYHPVEDILLMAAERKHWVTVRLCLKEIKGLDQQLLNKLLTAACEQNQYSDIELLLKLGAREDNAVNDAINNAASKEDKDWTIIELLQRLYSNPEHCPAFGIALLVALQHRKFSLARNLFKVVKHNNWRNPKSDYHRLKSTLFYVIKYSLNDLLESSYLLDCSYQDQHSETRLRLALDLARVRQNKAAIELLQDKVNSPPLNSLDAMTIVCILVFEAYFLGEKELAEWRLFHYGHQFDIIPDDCSDIILALKTLLPRYEQALSFLPYTGSGEAYRCVAKLFLYYKNTNLYLSYLNLTYSSERDLPCTEKNIAYEIVSSTPAESLTALRNLIKHTNHLDVWLGVLTNKLKHTFAEVINEGSLNEQYKRRKNIDYSLSEALFDINIFILGLISQKLLDNSLRTIDIDDHIILLFRIAYTMEHYKSLYAILDNNVLIDNIKDKLVAGMIEQFNNSYSYSTSSLDEELLRKILSMYSFNVTIKHIELALSFVQEWKLIPLLERLNETDLHNPKNYWIFHWAWNNLRFGSCQVKKEHLFTFSTLLGPIQTRHYFLIHILTQIYYIVHFNRLPTNVAIWNSNHTIKDFFDTFAANQRELYLTFHPGFDTFIPIYKDILKVINEYLSAFDYINAFPNEQAQLTTYQALMSLIKNAAPSFPFNFFASHPCKDFVSQIYTILTETNQMLDQIAIQETHKATIEPDPPDIIFYL